MNNRDIKSIIILGALIIFSLLGMQFYWVYNSWKTGDSSFNQSVHIALRNVANYIAEYNNSELPPKDLIKRLSPDYYVVNINDHIDANILEHVLYIEMGKASLTADFQYGIYDCENDNMVYGNYCEMDEAESKETLTESLPKYNEFDYYFGVKFPTRSNFLVANLNFTIFFSLLSLLLTGFFIYTISFIIRQRRVSELQKDFINNMTHEFKTPISSIQLSSNVLLNDEKIQSDPRLSQYANIIKDQNSRLNDQVEKVLNLAKTERDQFKLNLEHISLHTLIQKILHNNQARIQNSNARIHLDLNAPDDNIMADRLHLTNVLSNLLDNAIKYSKSQAEIKIETAQENGSLDLSIQDNGIGISKENQTKIFDKFYRVPTGNVHNVKGFGLGLFYVNNICEAHGWELNLESEINNGSTITINIKK